MSIRNYAGVVDLIERVAHDGADPSDPKEKKRRRILDAAAELFLQLGYRKTSIDDVAARAGVAKGTVYLYFKTKADILVHALAVEKLRNVEAMRPLFAPGVPARDKLRLLLRESFVLTTRMPLISRITSGDPEFAGVLSELDPALLRYAEDTQQDFFLDLILRARGGRKATDTDRERALVLRGLMLNAGRLVREEYRQGMSVERYAAALADLLVDGLVAPPAKTPKSRRKT